MKPKGMYMFLDPSAKSTKHWAQIETEKFTLLIVGVNTTEEGARLAGRLVDEGIQIIELCGAFGYAGAKVVSESVGNRASVGLMVHQVANAPNLAKALESWA